MEPTTLDTILSSFDLTTILAFVATAGVALVGLSFARKGIIMARGFIKKG